VSTYLFLATGALVVAVSTSPFAQQKDSEPLVDAVLARNGALIDKLLEAGYSPLAEDGGGRRPIVAAIATGNADAVRRFCRHGLDPDVEIGEEGSGITPLAAAAALGSDRMAAAILECKADVDRRTADGETPLLLAVERGATDVVRRLLSRTNAIDAADRDGDTPLIAAARAQSLSLVGLLLKAGADRDKANAAGKKAGDLATGPVKQLLDRAP
jgi:ankyrin repeat protein